PGNQFHVFNEKEEWQVELETLEKRKATVKVINQIQNKCDPKQKVSLYQAIPKKQALFELVIQKATELGVHDIYPLVTERTESKRLHKMERLQMIAIEATEQCGGRHVPTIHPPVDFKKVIGILKKGFMAYEAEEEKYLSDYEKELSSSGEIQLLIGPEGGFSEKEVELAKKNNVKSFSMGKRILRTETAAMAGLSLILLS
ncbi:MAG: 16S rRNA (uracil(1498)-N(3))-methyltransferase, partial [Deltaproteobacteria bacterium]|nr:16S rRNA (uracil(1498)-N(3))-methyltransferase [Deltaproteobacteria bacterium]